MPATSGKSLEELLAIKNAEETAGTWDPAGSKSDGKIENAIIALMPDNYNAGTVEQANAKLDSSTEPQVSGGFTPGGSGLDFGQGTDPINLGGLYNQYFNTDEIKAKKDEVKAIEESRDAAIGSVQSNPWYSQSTRGGKIAAVRSDSERNLGRINSELSRLQTDAQIQYNIQIQQYDINRQSYQDALTLFNSLVSSGALTSADSSDIANLSVQTGIPTSMINSIISSANNADITLQTYDDGTNQYIIALDPSGKVVNRTTLGPSKASGSGSGIPHTSYIPNGIPVTGSIQDLW